MAAQAVDLVAQRLLGDFEILRLPPRPAFPEVAAAPSGHDEDAFVVGHVEEFVALRSLPSRRIVFRPMSLDVLELHPSCAAEFSRSIMSGVHPPPRMRMFLPLMWNWRPPMGVELAGDFADAEFAFFRAVADSAH